MRMKLDSTIGNPPVLRRGDYRKPQRSRRLDASRILENGHAIVRVGSRAMRKAVYLFHLLRERPAHDQPHDGFYAFGACLP